MIGVRMSNKAIEVIELGIRQHERSLEAEQTGLKRAEERINHINKCLRELKRARDVVSNDSLNIKSDTVF